MFFLKSSSLFTASVVVVTNVFSIVVVGSDASLRHNQEDDLEDALPSTEHGIDGHAASALPILRA